MAFIPIGDDNSDRVLTPYVNYLLLALNVLVFVFLQGLGGNAAFTMAFSTVPAEIVRGEDLVSPPEIVHDPVSGDPFELPGLRPTPIPVYLTLLTSMFMHGGLAHLFGNMLFLWVFGDNLENRLGHARYTAFYLACGVLAGIAHVASTVVLGGDPLIPSLGASGAISGVLGGYMLLYPRRRVLLLMLNMIMPVRALTAIGIWFAFQFISGLGALGGGAQKGGVAYGAHIGGFLAGLVLIKAFTAGRPAPPATGRPVGGSRWGEQRPR